MAKGIVGKREGFVHICVVRVDGVVIFRVNAEAKLVFILA